MTSGCAVAAAAGQVRVSAGEKGRPNVLLITADDMHWRTPGCFGGGGIRDVTPNIDRLASEGMRFEHGHVTIAVCQPSRQVLMTGLYPHRNGGEGFEPIREDVTTLQERLRDAGYLNGILGKVIHLQPQEKFAWDMAVDQWNLGMGRNPSIYYRHAKEFLERAGRERKPFFLMANAHDPHRPFSGSRDEQSIITPQSPFPPPSRIFEEDEVVVPGFLPDIPDVRKEITQYVNSARRCDDVVGVILQALEESGQADNTLVMFLSDNGIAVPFAKTNCYLNSTKSPWLVRWPTRVKPRLVNSRDFVSGIDFMPTVLEACGLEPEPGVDGNSFLPLLSGKRQAGRDTAVTVFHKTIAENRYDMRCVHTARYGHIFNGWADGKTRFQNESMSGLTMNAMVEAAKEDPAIAERVELFLFRTPEELYDFREDPDALTNLAEDPEFQEVLQDMRDTLRSWMRDKKDPLEDVYGRYLSIGSLM